MITCSEKFSVGIPTMWRSPLIVTMLPRYEACPLVGEIIIVDNDISVKHQFKGFKKIVYIPQKENIFVNPAWNLIASKAKYRLILVNDDILIENVTELLTKLSDSLYEVTGARIYSTNNHIAKLDKFPAQSWGSFLCFKDKYKYIPEQLKIYMGDKFIFDNFTCGWIGGYITSPRSQTVKSLGVAHRIYEDGAMYAKLYSNVEENVIIRTSNRPNYFKNAVQSVRKYLPYAKIHVTVDDVKDLEYVKRICPDCNYYLVDREKIINFGRKIEIQRRFFPYNLYLNVVKPFINGWVQILDDDCQLVSKPIIPTNKKEIVISKVDVRSRIVPEVWKSEPKFGDIDMGGIVFHSSQMVDFTPQRGGDFQFISEMFKNNKVIWNNNVTVQMQTGLGFGSRQDLLQ